MRDGHCRGCIIHGCREPWLRVWRSWWRCFSLSFVFCLVAKKLLAKKCMSRALYLMHDVPIIITYLPTSRVQFVYLMGCNKGFRYNRYNPGTVCLECYAWTQNGRILCSACIVPMSEDIVRFCIR